jgi:hypothetical protein
MGDAAQTAIRARRNVRWIAAGVLAICLGGLGAALLYVNLSNAAPVISIKHTVYRDQVITADDLAITSFAPPLGIETVPAGRLGDIVGSTALTDLPAGGLLGPNSFGEPVVAAGAVRLGLRLEAGRLPSSLLPPGTGVQLVPVGRDGAAAPNGGAIPAIVATMPQFQSDGSALVDVTVSQDLGAQVAQLAAAGQLTLIRLAQAPR